MHDDDRQNEQENAGYRSSYTGPHESRRHGRDGLREGPDREILGNILSAAQWMRILLMVGFAILSWLLRFAQLVITIIQILFALISGRPNLNMSRAGTVLALYQAQIWCFLSYSSELRPYPFNDLPDSGKDLDESLQGGVVVDASVYQAAGYREDPVAGARPAKSPTKPRGRADTYSDMSFTDADGRVIDDDVPPLGHETPDNPRRDNNGQF